MSRFDYVQYDEVAQMNQSQIKRLVQDLENSITMIGTDKGVGAKAGRSIALALTKLEEVYMWAGKAIRDDQISRNGSAELQEQRNNS